MRTAVCRPHFLKKFTDKKVRILTGCCPNPFLLCLKRFLINLRLAPVDFKTRPLCGTYLPLRQDLLVKNVLMTAQRDFCLGNSPFKPDPITPSWVASCFTLRRSSSLGRPRMSPSFPLVLASSDPWNSPTT